MTSPSRFPGTVYGLVLNYRGSVEALGAAVHAAPYASPPSGPVLYIKPPNTYLPSGGTVAMPAGIEALRVQPSLGLVVGRTATRILPDDAWDHLEGMVLAAEVCVPHDSLYRPAIRQRCRDGFLPLGSPRAPVRDAVVVGLALGGVTRARLSTADLIRPIPRLLAEVSDFMTLYPGDVLLVGLPLDEPLARAGDAVTVEAAGFPTLSFGLASELDLDEGEAA